MPVTAKPSKKAIVQKPQAPPRRKTYISESRSMSRRQSFIDDNGNSVGGVVVPPNQIKLTDKEKQEDVPRVLTWADPTKPSNRVQYNYVDQSFGVCLSDALDTMAVHFAIDGHFLPIEGDEAKEQIQDAKKRKEEHDALVETIKKEMIGEGFSEEDLIPTKNQFNYSDRASQTYCSSMRERCVSTKPPPRDVYTSSANRWEIYDAYMNSYQMELAAEKSPSVNEVVVDIVHCPAMGNALKMLERIVNQNKEDEIFMDARYWDDQADEYREGEGSLLPLWFFSSERSKKKQVCALSWHPTFPDMFAVGFGSYDYLHPTSGLVYIYTLKNTAHPEFTFSVESGVNCLAFHPQHMSLMVVGCYDGTVKVYDIRLKQNKPIYASSIKTGKHTDPVWQVYWQEEDLAKELNFYSISSDGLVANWLMTNTELKMEVVMQLKLAGSTTVGTEEGKIHKCSKAYSGQYLETYEGHHMAVYSVKWNPFHPRIFLSCSTDWTVKVWDHRLSYPIMSFDLGESVADIAWAPYSSTVFAAVTHDGKIHVFDLSTNKHDPICTQKVVKKSKLTHVVFNDRDPFILVGDDNGRILTFKLSPNLRVLYPHKESQKKADVEIERMDKLITIALDAIVPEK